ncbi:MAG: glycoside hydrolase family 2, partial [Verrucomicrobiae bacterium]|nr:glycoside hydrolase family 2 [Verrucomicrobiae bacterium]
MRPSNTLIFLRTDVAFWLVLLMVNLALGQDTKWQPAPGRLMTKWAKDVSPDNVHPEYPRPMMVRNDWLNLNGLWDFAVVEKNVERPSAWEGKILVPFPIESALSGVMRQVNENQRLWYRRTFKVPEAWQGRQILLHFGAVDWETTVWVNGQVVGTHRGGYDEFGFNITHALKSEGEQEIIVAVWDPTDAGYQPRGKQVRQPGGIWYTPTTGIWQTVWVEPVPATYVGAFRVVPDIDNKSVELSVTLNSSVETSVNVRAAAYDGSKEEAHAETGNIAIARATTTAKLKISLPVCKLWSPDSPFLYDLVVAVSENGKEIDRIRGYFGMRKISLGKDENGTLRLCLNNKPLFQFGLLDQGFWPDGIYTAPTDDALRYDIEMTRELGYNMARKHVKVEPQRWYYWADKLGL